MPIGTWTSTPMVQILNCWRGAVKILALLHRNIFQPSPTPHQLFVAMIRVWRVWTRIRLLRILGVLGRRGAPSSAYQVTGIVRLWGWPNENYLRKEIVSLASDILHTQGP